ncbi:outer membrane porin GjpA [Mycobacterium sp. MAA66]|uniref:outer membrane porin GjpA n=1 Tax=Mycobacterium sp. MAA66 TaxID=3156297 RepID=UPI0035154CB7
MGSTVRPLLTTSVGVAGAAVIALSPVAPPLPDIYHPSLPELRSSAVAFAAGFDPLAPWISAFETAQANATKIGDVFFQAPAVALQQILVNQSKYLGEILRNPGTIGSVLGQIGHDVQTAIDTSVVVGADSATRTDALAGSIDTLHNLALLTLPTFLKLNPQAISAVKNIMSFAASPLSGVLIGLLGPALSPAVALGQSLQSFVSHLTGPTPNLGAAVQDLVNIPANMVGAFLNGANVNLSALAPLVNRSGILLSGVSVNSLQLNLGGLFSTGSTQDGIGGSIFNSLAMGVTAQILVPITLNIPGQRVGPLAALTRLSQLIAKALGWSGKGNPLGSVALPAAGAAAAGAKSLSITPAAADNSITSVPKVKALAATANTIATPASKKPAATDTKSDPNSADKQKDSPSKPKPSAKTSSDKSAGAAAKETDSTPKAQTSDSDKAPSTPKHEAVKSSGGGKHRAAAHA